MKKSAVVMVAAVCAAFAASASSIQKVLVRQQWPWSPKVNIDYVLEDASGSAHDVKLTLHDGATEIPVEFGSLSGDQFGVLPGERRLVWDPQFGGAKYSSAVLSGLTATVTIEEDEKLYMIVDLSEGGSAASYPVTFTGVAPAGGWQGDPVYGQTKIVLRKIPASTFVMGYTPEEISHYNIKTSNSSDFFQRRKVTLTKPYYIGIYPVTIKQQNMMGEGADPGWHWAWPINTGVSYESLRGVNASDQANWPNLLSDSILGRLNAKTTAAVSAVLPGYRFDLPTYAQWQCACRAGTTTCFNNGKDWAADGTDLKDSNLDEVAWYACGGTIQAVGQKAANAFGLYDMHGHVLEFIRDMMSSTAGRSNGVTNPQTDPLLRGWLYDRAWGCGGRANGTVAECLSNSATLIGTAGSNSNVGTCVGYRLALVAD